MEAPIAQVFAQKTLDHYVTPLNPLDYGTWAFWLLLIGFSIASWCSM